MGQSFRMGKTNKAGLCKVTDGRAKTNMCATNEVSSDLAVSVQNSGTDHDYNTSSLFQIVSTFIKTRGSPAIWQRSFRGVDFK